MVEAMSRDEATAAVEDLLGTLQDLYHRIESISDLEAYGVSESLLASIEKTLERYDAFE